MKNHALRYGRPSHCVCCKVYSLLYVDIQRIRADQRNILNYVRDKQETEIRYLTAKETWERVGISESTLLRCQQRGEIAVAKVKKRKKYFRDCDVERLRREYWGRG
ncbi:hypothetical protein ACFQRK_09630 [Parapedobacter sp. GCM10030251]|uniref:hypothetical protein n=1 Tax=Parapedobacter sp. GCM10030251 TaxID=3273419 RepID=UPI003614AA14